MSCLVRELNVLNTLYQTVVVMGVYRCRLESLTLKRFIVTEAAELDKLTWLKSLYIEDSGTDPMVSVGCQF